MGELTRFTLDGSCRRYEDGTVLIGGSPLRLFRLTPGGAKVVDAIERGAPVGPGASKLTGRLLDAGAIHPIVQAADVDVTLVIPAFRADPARVATIVATTGAARSIVVDDASPWPFPALDGMTVVRSEVNGGPGAARETGLAMVTTPYVAFVDADVSVRAGWVRGLAGHFVDPRVAMVAPRVRAAPHNGPLARFESLRSPLDLGDAAGRVRAGTRVAYVPAAALLCRVDALREVGGFDVAMRTGEDVDLVWRLDEAGWCCRYDPGVEVEHDVRVGPAAWVNQRRGYGRSATALAVRHPGSVPPVQLSAWSAGAWGVGAAGAPVAGAALAVGSAVALIGKLPRITARNRIAARLAGLGHLHAGRILASSLTRTYWPIALVVAGASRRARRVLVAAALVPSLYEWWKVRRRIDPVTYTALRVVDDAAYGLGVWEGALRDRSAEALVPDLTSWPQSRRYDRSHRRAGGTVSVVPPDSESV